MSGSRVDCEELPLSKNPDHQAYARKIAVIGLGYVGLPVAAAFARRGTKVVGFDIDSGRIRQLRSHYDHTGEVTTVDLDRPELYLTDDPTALRTTDFFIVTVP